MDGSSRIVPQKEIPKYKQSAELHRDSCIALTTCRPQWPSLTQREDYASVYAVINGRRLLQEMFSSNFTSTYLREALREVYDSLPHTDGFRGARFFVSSALARLSEYEPILEFATDPKMIDTGMYLMARVELAGEKLSASEKSSLKKVKARIKTFESALRKDIRLMSPPGTRKVKQRYRT